uniref:hypothetical protein n=1 Tax=uncultured Flavonifractor sp. TaxID=1193534 RepID=UPI00260FB9E1|nr:hypothetical protein [uncultured Flavonifractor sp.]
MNTRYRIPIFALILLLSGCNGATYDTGRLNDCLITDSGQTSEEDGGVSDTKTEIGTVQEVKDDVIILQNGTGEIYYIPHASQYKVLLKEGEKLVFSYTEKVPSERGYILTVKWLEVWSSFSQDKFVHGVDSIA